MKGNQNEALDVQWISLFEVPGMANDYFYLLTVHRCSAVALGLNLLLLLQKGRPIDNVTVVIDLKNVSNQKHSDWFLLQFFKEVSIYYLLGIHIPSMARACCMFQYTLCYGQEHFLI